jgi:hypothetical protein
LTDIKPGVHGYNVNLKIVQVNLIRYHKYENFKILEGVAGDRTAIINFRIEGNYADLVEKSVGKTLAFRNVNSDVVKGFHRIRIDLWGKITSSTVTIGEINENESYVNNLSSIEYIITNK